MTGSAWPPGEGEIARLVRAYDWAATPLGAIEGWPQSLKTAVDLVLTSGHAMQLAWGPERTMLYNGAYAPMLGDRHPGALGNPFRDAWPDIWEKIEPLVEQVFAGETVQFESMPLVMTRYGYPEETWWTFSYSPVRDEAGEVAGLLNVTVDATSRVRAERAEAALRAGQERQGFLLGLSDALRPLADAAEIQATTTRLLGAHLGADRVMYAEVEGGPGAEAGTIRSQYVGPARGGHATPAPFPEQFAFRPFGTRTMAARYRGELLVVADIDAVPGFEASERAAWAATGVRAAIVAPLAKGGRLVAEFGVHSAVPRAWTATEAELVQDVAERTWAAAERARAETTLRKAEERHRAELERQVRARTAELKQSRDLLQATLDSSTDMIQVFEAVRDETGEVVDFRWLLNNHTSESRYGEVRGQSLLKRNPGVVEEGIFDAFKRVVETGEPEQAERHYAHEQFDGWFYQSVVRLGDGVATTTKEITAWKQAQEDILRLRDEVIQAKLDESEARFRGLVHGMAQAVWETDADGVVVSDSPSWRAYTGQTLEQWLGHGWLDAIHPDDRAYAERQWREAVAARRNVDAEFRLRNAGGGWRWTNVRVVLLIGPDGSPRKWAGMNVDISERKRVGEALRESEERLRSAVEVGRLGLWDWNIRTGEVHWSDEHFRMEGYEVGEVTPSYEAWAARVHPDDLAETEAALRHAMEAGEEYVREYRAVHPDGSVRWHLGRGRFFYEDGRQPVRMVGAMMDTTERRDWEERQKVLVAELQHRTRNLLAVVRSLARSSIPPSPGLDEYDLRLAALGRVQGLLSRSPLYAVSLGDLVQAELSAVGDRTSGRITVGGPEVKLPGEGVQTVALALHELATNAVKHGALAQASGRLSVTWHVEANHSGGKEGGGRLVIDWREVGVAMAGGDSPPARRGYGTELITRALPYQLRAETALEFTPDGVRCRIALPAGAFSHSGNAEETPT